MAHPNPLAWPIRWRLTALNVGLLTTTLLVVGGLFLLRLDSELLGLTADQMRDQARPLIQRGVGWRWSRSDWRSSQPPKANSAGTAPARPPEFERLASVLSRSLAGPDTGVAVFDPGGRLIAASEASDEAEAWPQPAADQLEQALGGNQVRAVAAQQTRRTLMLLLPLISPEDSVDGVLVLARSLDFVDRLEEQLRTALVIGALLSVLIAGGLILPATRAALRPLDRVVLVARQIGAGDLSERLRFTRRDEIGVLAEAFDHMLDRLAAALGAQRRFVADAAHELRTPLTALGGMVEMLQVGADRGDQATVRRMFATMEREIDRLGRLVGDLLTLSRLDADRPLSVGPVELEPLVMEVANQTRLLSRGQSIQLDVQAAPTVLGDPDRLKQVLINLADNALKYTPADRQIVFQLVAENGRARLAVADTGCGIPSDILPRVTERFVRGDGSRARSSGGFGLGLSIAHGIVNAHRGTISIDSRTGRGTTVVVTLPRVTSD
jgi:two-component system, OmpR family, sensor kinase